MPFAMRTLKKLACGLALCSLTTPALANDRSAAFAGASDRSPVQTSMFVGARFKFGFDRKANAPRYRASLGISGMARDPGTAQFRVGEGIELALTGKKKPTLYMGGSDVGEMWRTARLSGGGKTALIVVGAVALLGGAALLVLDSARCEEEGHACD